MRSCFPTAITCFSSLAAVALIACGSPFDACQDSLECGSDASSATDSSATDGGAAPADGAAPDREVDGSAVDAAAPDVRDAGVIVDASTPTCDADSGCMVVDAGGNDAGLADAADAIPPCDGLTCMLDDAHGVFVSASLGRAGGNGSKADPFLTIGAGLQAAAHGKAVIVCAEAYPEAVTLPNNVMLFGNATCAGGAWAVGTGHAIVQSPTSPAVTATNLTSAHLESIEFDAPDQSGNASASSFGMVITGSSGIALVNVTLHAGAAGAGASRGSGAAPTPPGSPCWSSDGANGGAGSDGSPKAGSYSAAGYAPGNGGDGASGENGHNGTGGGAGECKTVGQGPCVFKTLSNHTQACLNGGDTPCADNGLSGCGSGGGAGGLGGSGGGSSVALFVWGSRVSVTGGALASGAGGSGGAGTWGGSFVGSPTSGSAGASRGYTDIECTTSGPCTSHSLTGTLQGGSPGGPGGTGGRGGNGAGGSGGDSYSYYAGGGAMVTVSPSTSLSQASAGSAGPGAAKGLDGHAGPTNTVN